MRWLFNLILVLAPILSSYSIVPSLDLGTMSLALLVPIVFVLYPIPPKWPKYYLIFLLYVLVDSLFITNNIPIRVLLYSFILLGGCMYIDKEYFYKIYECAVFFSCAFFIVQFLFQYVFGRNIPGIFSFLPTVYGDTKNIVDIQLETSRLSSFFLEPSYFAQYLYPYLCINLFGNKITSIYKAIGVSAVLLLLRSGIGLSILAFVWFIWVLQSNEINYKLKWRIITFISIGVIIIVVNSDLGEYVISRSSEFSFFENVDSKHMSSGFERFFNGYYVYNKLPLSNKLYGINPDELMESAFYSGTLLNGVSTILIMEGLLGLIFFIPHLIKLYYQNPLLTQTLVICIVFLLFSESYFVTCRMLFAMVIAYTYSLQKPIKS